MRRTVLLFSLAIPISLLSIPASTSAVGADKPAPPPKQGQVVGTWTSGNKDGFGTAYTYDSASSGPHPSRVWFTLGRGALNEVFYPTLDTAAVGQLILVASDGKHFVANETQNFTATTSMRTSRALSYRVNSIDRVHHIILVKEVVTDPARDVVLMRLRIKAPRNVRVYVQLEPTLHNTSNASRGAFVGQAFESWKPGTALALAASEGWGTGTVGYRRINDGLTQLLKSRRILHEYGSAGPGRIGATVELRSRAVTLALGFGPSRKAALAAAKNSLKTGFSAVATAYENGWARYTSSLDSLGGHADSWFYTAAMTIKAAEDKTYSGAIVASPTHPFGQRTADDPTGHGYALVWPRDLYHSAMGLLAAGDARTANEALDYLAHIQKSDGSFPQNVEVQGDVYFSGLQMDEVADPILLAWRLGRKDLYAGMVKPAAELLVRFGPSTNQERWEEAGGYSPATIAAEIAGLVAAADMARTSNDDEAQHRYLAIADAWEQKIEAWTYTTTGPLGDHRYYLRVSQGDPDAATQLALANDAGTYDQREVVDPSFLELVRLGVRDPHDPHVLATLPVVDAVLKGDTLLGPSWHRYNHDAYGDPDQAGGQGKGHLWPVLSGERGMYDLMAGELTAAQAMGDTLRRFTGPTGFFPEQVYESSGKPTTSANPLIWAEGEYIIFERSLIEGKPFDRPAVVTQRYLSVPR